MASNKTSATSVKHRPKSWTIGESRLHCGDSRSILRSIKSNSVDMILTSPPYSVGKKYENGLDLAGLKELLAQVLAECHRVLREGGNLCWQVGYHVFDGQLLPLDYVLHEIHAPFASLKLRNRIVWQFGHGLHCQNRFSGRHEVVLWYSKGEPYFNLDAVRVPQKYPGKTHYKGPNKGEFSGNPSGKNPEDVWSFDQDTWYLPNVNATHREKTDHPCQFPVALAQRLIRALCRPGGVVLDPFAGAGTTPATARLEKRRFIAIEKELRYCQIAKKRIEAANKGVLEYRDESQPLYIPNGNERVARKPAHFR